MSPTVHIVPHTHWDREWYHAASRFQLRLARVVDAAMALIEKDKLPSFLLDGQGIVLDDYLAMRPESRERLCGHLESGRLECGPWYVLADNLLVSGEALVRNLHEGGRAVRRSGGQPMRVGYAPDTFGHPAILPSLFAGFGIHNAVTWRGFGGERGQEKDLYRWVGPDGESVVMIHLPPQGYENGANLPVGQAAGRPGGQPDKQGRDELKARWASIRAVLERRARSPHWLILNGADHHAPQPDLRQAVRALMTLTTGCDFEIGSLGEYAARIEHWAHANEDQLPLLVGELRHGRRSQWVLQGCHSARLNLKQMNARCQRLLERFAEPLAALTLTSAQSPVPSAELQAAWRTLLENHPHDSICGTSTDGVHREMATRFDRCRVMADEIIDVSLDALIGLDPDAARVQGRAHWNPALMIFNPAPRRRSSVIIANVALFSGDVKVGQQGATSETQARHPGELVLRDSSGKAVLVQELSRSQGYDRLESPRYYPDCDAVEWRCLAIAAEDLPPLGVTALRVEERGRTSTYGPPPMGVTVSNQGLANQHVLIRVDPDGTVSMAEGETRRQVRGLGAIECMTDEGDSYTSSPRGPNQTRKPDIVAVRVMHNGPLVGEIEIVRRWYGIALGVTTLVRLDAGARHAEFSFHFENKDPQRRVRAAFPLGRSVNAVVADGPFGPVERPPWPVRKRRGDLESPDPCAPMQRYVSVASAKDAMTVFTDGLPSYEAKPDGTVLVTIMRSFTQLSRNDLPERPGHAGWPTQTPRGGCLGAVHARMAVMLHDPGALDERDEIEAAADAFLAPPVGFMRRWLLKVPLEIPGPELRGDGLVFSALKPAEDGKGIVLRCFNDRTEPGRGAWVVGEGFKTAVRCRLDETPGEKLPIRRGIIDFAAGPKEIVTILLR